MSYGSFDDPNRPDRGSLKYAESISGSTTPKSAILGAWETLTKTRGGRIKLLLVTLASAVVTFAASVSYNSGSKYSSSVGSIDTDPFSTYIFNVSSFNLSAFKVSVSNDYGEFDGQHYAYLDDAFLVEPHKKTTIELQKFDEVYDLTGSTSYEFYWKFVDSDGNRIQHGTTGSPSWTGRLEDPDKVKMEVMVAQNETTVVHYTEATIYVKYVKRELRSLSHADKEAFLNAAAVLFNVSTDEGRAIYGDMYTSVATFTEMHALASNDIMCDSYHDGSGFLTHHLALQLSFEYALRAVDPSVTLPYWDFSIEGQEIQEAGEDPDYFLEVTPFLSHSWFGTTDEDGHIADSKFAHITMPVAADDSIVRSNSYGIIRSPWNNNPDPEVTRHLFDVCGVVPTLKPIPSCSTHFDLLNVSSLGSFQMASPGLGHGPMHVNSGGVYGGCSDAWEKFQHKWSDELFRDVTTEEMEAAGFDYNKVYKYDSHYPIYGMVKEVVIAEYFHVYRSLWRSHMCSRDASFELLQCPDSCDGDTGAEECKCYIPGLQEGTVDWGDVFNCVVSKQNKRDLFKAFMPVGMLKDLTVMAGTTQVSEGEMLESASPGDILFWMIHPAIDRLTMAKRLDRVTKMGSSSFENFAPGTEVWMEYSKYTLGEGQNPTFPDGYTCVGHGRDDPVLLDELPLDADFETYADSDGDGVVSNWEFYLAIDPNEADGIDYVYDDYTWSHCERFLGTEGEWSD